MYKLIISLIAPLLSLFILVLGNGLFNTLISLRLGMDNVSSWIIGAATGFYYLGMTIGAFRVEKFISRVGHIRAFATFASITAVVTLVPGIITNPYFWIFLRFIAGICIAGLYVVIESWLLAASTIKTRSKVLSVYMIALYCAQALGQFLLNLSDPRSIIPFCIIAILSSLSVLPVCMTYRKSPDIEQPSTLNFFKLYNVSPTGIMGCLVSGLVLGAVYGLIPVFTDDLGFSTDDIALTMFMIIFGGTLLQYPVGHLSDIFDRRFVLFFLNLITALLSIVLIFAASYAKWLFLSVSFFFGGVSFVLYPLAISHACDYLEPHDIIAATGGLALSYGLGASLGPMIAPAFINYLGDNGLFIYFTTVTGLFSSFILWRMTRRKSLPHAAQQHFIPVPRGTPIANELFPRAKQSEHSTGKKSKKDE